MKAQGSRRPADPARLTFVDVGITVLLGIIVALGLDGPAGFGAARAPDARPGDTPLAPAAAEPALAGRAAEPEPALAGWTGAGAFPVHVSTVAPSGLAADPVLAGLREDLAEADAAALAARVDPGPGASRYGTWPSGSRPCGRIRSRPRCCWIGS